MYVDNPLVGARGAAVVFGPQKGAMPEMVEELEQGLQNYARVLQQQTEVNVCQMAVAALRAVWYCGGGIRTRILNQASRLC